MVQALLHQYRPLENYEDTPLIMILDHPPLHATGDHNSVGMRT